MARKKVRRYLRKAVNAFVAHLTESPSYSNTRKLSKLIRMINQSVSPSKEEHISVNNISEDSGADSEDSEGNEVTDEDDDDRNQKHCRRESSRLPVLLNDNSTPANEASSAQPSKKWIRPFVHPSESDKRRFLSSNPFHSRGSGRNNNHSHSVKWTPPLEMHDPTLMASSHKSNGFRGDCGFIPGLGNGMMEAMQLELGLPHQRCPDYEKLGYCIRGSICPMEHGLPRVVVENVQDLQSLFQLVGLQPAQVPKPVTLMKALRPNGMLPLVTTALDADMYDPDQPLWNTNSQPVDSPDRIDTGTTAGISDPSYHPSDPDPSVWGRNGKSNRITGLDARGHGQKEHKAKPDQIHEEATGTDRQRASRTLYICGVPQKDNRPAALFSHFKKFGRVVDIYMSSEKAFVEFSKREEAEAALLAPDAVMGNPFIKVLWANCERVSDEASSIGYQPKQLLDTSQALVSGMGKGHNSVSIPGLGTTPKVVTVNAQNVGVQRSGWGTEPPVPKKLENMELLEELRKKQEILAREREELSLHLEMLEKQASAGKRGENNPKINKADMANNSLKPAATTPKDGNLIQQHAMQTAAQRTSTDPIIGSNFRGNRFKTDNRTDNRPTPDAISDAPVERKDAADLGNVIADDNTGGVDVENSGTIQRRPT